MERSPSEQKTIQHQFDRFAKLVLAGEAKKQKKEYARRSQFEATFSELSQQEMRQLGILDSLINELPGGVAVFKVGTALECQYFNDGFAMLSDSTHQELSEAFQNGWHIESAIAPPDLSRVMQQIRTQTASGDQLNTTYRFLTKAGALRWLHMNASKLREEDGRPVYYCVFTVPSNEATLYRNLVEDSATGVLVAEQKTHQIIYCNSMMRELYHLASDIPLVGRSVYDVLPAGNKPFTSSEVKALPRDKYVKYYRQHADRYLGIRAKALEWNGMDCYILYVSDETQEHQKRMRQETLLNQVPMGIGIYEIVQGTAKQIYMNDGYYRMVGETRLERQSKQHRDFLSFVHPDDVGKILSAVNKFINGSSEETVDHRILCGDGEYRWFRLIASTAERDGEKIKLYCSYANINDAILSQEALKSINREIQKQYTQERFERKLLENDSMVALQFNVTQDKLISYRVNQGLFSEFEKGTSGAAIRPDIAHNIPTEEERSIAADFFSREKALERFENGVKEFSAEYRRRLNNGRLYWIRSICRLDRDEESGDLISYTFMRNIDTERKKDLTAESVIDEETDFVMLLNIVSNTAMLLRLRNAYVQADRKLYTEFPFEDASNVGELNMVEAEDRESVSAFFHTATLYAKLKKETAPTITYRHRYTDGTVRRKKARAFFLDDLQEDIVIVRRDITDIYQEEQEQKRVLKAALEEAKSASRAKGDFLSRMSHDLRTPMNVIIGLTSMAMESADQTEEMKYTLSNITSSAEYLLSLINDCLDLEKINSGKIELHPVAYPYADFYDRIHTMIEPLCQAKNITFVIEFRDAAHPTIVADKMRMDQIFYNLLSNAVKFTPEGGKIELLISNSTVRDGYVYFSCIVRDNGVGMSEEFQLHMFEAFAQETNRITPEYQGSGLGLSIVQQLVELMGATISVNSKLGVGTEFRLDFCLPETQPTSTAAEPKAPTTLNSLHGKRVLLAEDHPLNAMIAVKLLQKAGMTVTTSKNGQEALEQFCSADARYFDAILMDIRMPVMNGLEAAKAIRAAARPDAKTIPIIAITANAFDADVEESLRAGMNAHLSKPIESRRLYETLAKCIEK